MENKISHDSEVPAHGQQVITACAFIHHEFDGIIKVFLPKRAETKKFLPNKFELPGGHIDFGENLIVGLKREIKEEFGVEVNVGDVFAAFDYINEIKGSQSVEVVYFAQLTDSIENITLNPEDHSEYVWLAASEVHEIAKEMGGVEDPEFQNILKGFKVLAQQQ